MKDLNIYLQEKLQDKEFALQYYRQATYFRLADQFLLLRKARGLTQTELADKADTTQTVVSRLENVSVRPSLETVVKLAEALDAVVEVRLVPLEQIQAEQEKEALAENEQAVKNDAFELVMSLDQTRKLVTWKQPSNAWVLGERPSLQPVTETKKILDFA